MLFTVVDTETTGTDPEKDALVEIAAIDVENGVVSDKPRMALIKPPIPIPPESSAVHHIIAADVADAGPAREVVPQVLLPGRGAIYVAHNSAFEQDFLTPYLGDVSWLCTYKAALRVYPNAPAHNLQTLRYWLNLPVDRAIADLAHRAMPDTYVDAYLLRTLLGKAAVQDMLMWTLEPPLLPACPLNPHRGKPWPDVPVDFLMWIIGLEKQKDRDMSPDTIWNAKHELDRRANEQQAASDSKLAAERAAYVDLAKQALVLATTVEDLEKWFLDEKPHREAYGIVKDDPLYVEIVKACGKHKATLPPKKEPSHEPAAEAA